MLKEVTSDNRGKAPALPISAAPSAGFFPQGLEFNAPARGPWNIVHMAMLIPELRQIYICAQGCLRGVILTAAEMNALDRMSWVSVSESDVFDGTMEQKVIDGVSDIICRLDRKPRAVMVVLSCIHFFAGCDFEMILDELRQRYPEIGFTDGYMNPTMRKTMAPDIRMRVQNYSLIGKLPADERSVGIIGNDFETDSESELVKIIKGAGLTLKDLTLCKTYDEYLAMGDISLAVTTMPTGFTAGKILAERLGIDQLHLPTCYEPDKIQEQLDRLCERLGTVCPDLSKERQEAENALKNACERIGDIPVAIDATAVPRPFELAALLHKNGANVRHIVADAVSADEAEAFEYLRENQPDLLIHPTAGADMYYAASEAAEKTLAIGQKSAYYFAADNFVNIVLGGGLYGFTGLRKLAEMITDAYDTPKDRRKVIQHKGFGCESCL